MQNQSSAPGQNADRTHLYLALAAPFIALVALLLYTFTHESGHALAGLLFGGKLTEFNANFFNLSGHVGIDGTFSRVQDAIISASGVSFPILLWAVWFWRLPQKVDVLLELIRLAVSMATINAILAWIAIPILTLYGQTASDDSFNFLRITQFAPLLVSAAASLVYLGCWALFLKRLGGFSGILRRLRSLRLFPFTPDLRRSLIGALAVAAVVLSATLSLNLILGTPDVFRPPAGYERVELANLAQKGYANEIAYAFSIQKPTRVGLYFLLKDIRSGPVRIALVGPNGLEDVFLRFDDPNFQAGKASVHPDPLSLAPGQYEIRLTFPQNSGTVEIFMQTLPE